MKKVAFQLTIVVCLSIFFSLTARADVIVVRTIEQLRDAVVLANNSNGALVEVEIDRDISVPEPLGETDNALPVLTGNLLVMGDPFTKWDRRIYSSSMNGKPFRLFEVGEGGRLQLDNLEVQDFGGVSDGGAVLLTDGSSFNSDAIYRNNHASRNGGAIAAIGNNIKIDISSPKIVLNAAGGAGGGVSIIGTNIEASIIFSWFIGNRSGSNAGCALNINTDNAIDNPIRVKDNQFISPCGGDLQIENENGVPNLQHNTFRTNGTLYDSTANAAVLLGNILDGNPPAQQKMQVSAPTSKDQPEDNCRDFGIGSFVSLGYNISNDDTCSLDQLTDQPNTDSLIAENDDGLFIPQPGSPAIDGGSAGVVQMFAGGPAVLPCGYRDIQHTARPQDANGDGIFECDVGAIEIPGSGEVTAGHSAVFFNPARNGEGNYVEILDNGVAVVYTFTYNPVGDGPAWFIGVGEYAGNSIIMDELFRPTGATFGDAFDTSDIDFTPAGSMSMVFPDCTAAAPGGNIAYTGENDLGYEGLISRATRLSNITGCGIEVPDPNAGLSGSFFDPTRNGEGLIVEWLTNGDVLVVFFTYGPDGKQFWLVGQASANGKTVTMTAVYPTAFTPWGRNFDASEVALSDWGTFTLTWTDCNTLVFDYSSTVAGFGMGTRNYTRLSTLTGTTCPGFP